MVEKQIGRHTVSFRAPALFESELSGDLSAAEMREFRDFVLETARDRPYVLLLNGVRELGSIGPEARKIGAEMAEQVRFRVVAYHSAGFVARIMIKLLLGSMRLLSSSDVETRFFDTGEEARAWIEEKHRALYPEASSAG